jgi:hypothetical protein
MKLTCPALIACLFSAACTGSPSTGSPVPVAGTTTITFNEVGANRTPFAIHHESGYVILPTAGEWVALTTYGHPAPFVEFIRTATANAAGDIQVTADGAAFRFSAVDLYSSITTIPYVFDGYLGQNKVFSTAGTVPNTFGNFITVRNPFGAELITTLVIRLTNPPIGCIVVANCTNPVGLDNIIVGR